MTCSRLQKQFLQPLLILLGFSISFAVTPLTGQTLTEKLVAEPVDQLIADARRFGDPQRGAMVFFEPTMNCAKCHEGGSNDRRLGPDLAEKREIEWVTLAHAVLEPSRELRKGFETVVIQLVDGRQLQGILVEQSEHQLIIDQIEQPEKPLVIPRDEIEDWKFSKRSTMPDGLANQMTDRQQFLDLLSYLDEIARGGPTRAAALRPATVMTSVPLPEYESRVDHARLIRGLNRDALDRGEETYRLRCASCHGTVDQEGSMPTSLRFASGNFKNGNDPYRMYMTLTHGFGMMNPQHWMVPQQKYEVIHYIRERFLKPHNPTQYAEVDDGYLAALPPGDTLGPKPVIHRPWTQMNYGPSLMNTIEVSSDGSNIAQKGIAIRLDPGPGGVESGSHWMMYDHDTMRMAGAWTGRFIDYEGIHFNGVHGQHPKIAGPVQFQNPTGPGWGRPEDQSFVDNRLIGRDGKRYGPLDRDWAKYQGMYRYGRQSILQYTVGDTKILETPGLMFVDQQPVYTRTLNLAGRDQELVLQIADVPGGQFKSLKSTGAALIEVDESFLPARRNKSIEFNGTMFGEIASGDAFDMYQQDFTITGRINIRSDGTIFAKTRSQPSWIPNGTSLFVRGNRLTYDIGWVGAVAAKKPLKKNRWHEFAMTWRAKDGRVQFFVDGKKSGSGGTLKPNQQLEHSVIRIGHTNDNFPDPSSFEGQLQNLSFYQRLLTDDEIADPENRKPDHLVGSWSERSGSQILDRSDQAHHALVNDTDSSSNQQNNLLALTSSNLEQPNWRFEEDALRLVIPPGEPLQLVIAHRPYMGEPVSEQVQRKIRSKLKPVDLKPLISGGPSLWPEKLTTEILTSDAEGPFAVDVLTRPTDNPWQAQLRLTGLDFLPGGNEMVVSAWDGSVWKVSGFGSSESTEVTWKRIAAGLFQPLGIRYLDGKTYVTCRDQIVVLHDLNGDGEMDWYECFNNDHQVTEHFHEFAMGLQTDEEGNFYYAKSARHAKTAVVPHHGTLLKVSPDGKQTEILATGFRAANGVCLNPDGSFVVTDQEGHWNPKNRINWVRPGGFYGNMFGYHDVEDESDSAMDAPLCWITNAFDRSPSELLWVDSEKWKPLNGSLLNLSYGYGKVYIVPHEEIDGQMQGGMCEFPIPQFPTGVMRGRFHEQDGQLYCCGMFAWGGNQQQPGGLYRIRYTGQPVHLPVGLRARQGGIEITFSGPIDRDRACDAENYAISTWDLKRTANYGSDHLNEKRLEVRSAELRPDRKTVWLDIPDIQPTWGMEINYAIETSDGKRLQGKIHNTIYRLGDPGP